MSGPDLAPFFVPCRNCGSEGYLYSGHPNDPNPRCVGPCPVCEATGMEEADDALPVECDDLLPLVPA